MLDLARQAPQLSSAENLATGNSKCMEETCPDKQQRTNYSNQVSVVQNSGTDSVRVCRNDGLKCTVGIAFQY